MNANELLKKQHREVEQKYQRFLQAAGTEREEIGRDILTDLTAHAEIEEELYYPALEVAGERSVADEFRAEHAAARTLIAKLSMMDTEDAAYEPTMRALMEAVMAHSREEESDGMPQAARMLGRGKLDALGPKMEARFRELKESTLKRLWAAIT